MGGVRVSNPEDYVVKVNIEVVFHRQTVNSPWQTMLIAGIPIAVAGIVLMFLALEVESRNR